MMTINDACPRVMSGGIAGAGSIPRLAARDVEFAYPGARDLPVVSDWSAQFHPSTVTAMTGPSGSGKSTRLYVLAMMLRLTSGQIELDGERVDDVSDAARSSLRAHRFGFVFQDAALDPTRTVIDNIVEAALYRGQNRAEAVVRGHELMERFGITIPAHRKPGQISGGQAQRIALCRALVGAPDILLADEPTGNLDATSADVVLDAFREHADNGGCVIVVTHDQSVAARADARLHIEVPS